MMVEFYVLKIKRGELELKDVPEFWRAKVENRLAEERER